MERVDLAQWLGLAAALGLASGVRLYAVLLVLGLVERFHWAALPPAFEPLGHPFVLVAAAFMVVVELFADKIPVLDSAWDVLHTFVRIPAGAALAAAALGGTSSTWTLVAAILGGSLAATSHFAKAGTRVAVNASPEPFSNFLVSTLEDVGVGALLWLALAHPWIALAVVAVLAVAALLLARLVWKLVAGGVRRLFGRRERVSPAQ
ncbi:MAG: DUF4126 domain-containing protein [Candidatus Eisenbacteria bacterium]